LGEAITFMLNHWDALTAYLQDGRLIRTFAIGRKNWLFSGRAENLMIFGPSGVGKTHLACCYFLLQQGMQTLIFNVAICYTRKL